MAVNSPRARVIRLKRQGNVSIRRDPDSVAARGIVKAEPGKGVLVLIVGVAALGQHGKVVTVEMDGVAGGVLALVGVDEAADVGRDDEVDEAAVEVVCRG